MSRHGMWVRRSQLLALVLVGACLAPVAVQGQLLKTIKEHAAKKVKEQKAHADSTVLKATDKAVDSTLTKTNRGVDTVVNKGTAAFDTVLNRAASGVSGAANWISGSDHIAADLAKGRVALPELRFAAGSDALTPDSDVSLKRLAAALSATQGAYLVEGHVAESGAAAADQDLSQRRAVAVKARLIAEGVPGERLFAMGFGSARPPAGVTKAEERIEVARMQ